MKGECEACHQVVDINFYENLDMNLCHQCFQVEQIRAVNPEADPKDLLALVVEAME